jgi:hypothetical protein
MQNERVTFNIKNSCLHISLNAMAQMGAVRVRFPPLPLPRQKINDSKSPTIHTILLRSRGRSRWVGYRTRVSFNTIYGGDLYEDIF